MSESGVTHCSDIDDYDFFEVNNEFPDHGRILDDTSEKRFNFHEHDWAPLSTRVLGAG